MQTAHRAILLKEQNTLRHLKGFKRKDEVMRPRTETYD